MVDSHNVKDWPAPALMLHVEQGRSLCPGRRDARNAACRKNRLHGQRRTTATKAWSAFTGKRRGWFALTLSPNYERSVCGGTEAGTGFYHHLRSNWAMMMMIPVLDVV